METPVAAPAAPAAPPAAPAAPAAAPATPPAAPPQAPPPPAPPAAAPPAAAPPAAAGDPAAPAAPAAPAGPPKATDFPNTAEGVEQFIEANEQWKLDHPDEAAAAAEEARQAAQAAQPGAQPAEEQAKPPAEEKPPAEAQPGAQPPVVTPKALDELFSAKPALKAAFDADPEAKGAVMEMARGLEAAKPVIELLPTVEEARSVINGATTFWNIQHGFAMAAENPEAGDRAFGQLVDLFTLRDDKGAPVMKDGQPVLAESFDYLTQKVATGALGGMVAAATRELTALGERLKGHYPDQGAKAADEAESVNLDYKVKALQYVAELLKADNDDTAGLPALPDDATPAQREYQARLEKQQQELKASRGQDAKAKRTAERKALETRVQMAYGQGIGAYVDNELKARREQGEVIPDFILERKWINPNTGQETNVRDFGMRIYNRFTTKINSIPSVASKLRELELGGPQMEAARLDYLGKLRADYLPKIFNEEFQSIQDGIRSMASQGAARRAKVEQVARVEPQTGGQPPAARPQPALTGEALDRQAEANLQNNPEFLASSRSEKMEMLIMEKERIRNGGR